MRRHRIGSRDPASIATPLVATLAVLAVPFLHLQAVGEPAPAAQEEQPLLDGALALRADVRRFATAIEDAQHNFESGGGGSLPELATFARRRRALGEDAARRAFELVGNVSRVIVGAFSETSALYLVDGITLDFGSGGRCSEGYKGVDAALAHLRRDWHQIGRRVRDVLHGAIAGAVAAAVDDASAGRVVVPGAGLGRLALDLAAAGFHIDAVECSNTLSAVFAALASAEGSAVRKQCVRASATEWSNAFHGDERDQYRLDCPDEGADVASLAARAAGAGGSLTFTVGDFSAWAAPAGRARAVVAVATAFFVDTIHSIVATVDRIVGLLRSGLREGAGSTSSMVAAACGGRRGAVWVNAGPLSYGKTSKLLLSWEEVRAVAEARGVMWIREDRRVGVPYSDGDRAGMYTEMYTVPLSVGVVCDPDG